MQTPSSTDPFPSPSTSSINLYNKKILSEIMAESTNMELRMLEASKYYYLISNLIFFPSVIVSTFIGAFILTLNCTALVCSNKQLMDTVSSNENSLLSGSIICTGNLDKRHSTAFQYMLASLAFLNALLVGTQKAIRPSEKGEMFQVMARRWGAFLRQMVAFKQTSQSSSPYSTKKLKAFLSNFNTLVENSPLLPQWLLTKTRMKQDNKPNTNQSALLHSQNQSTQPGKK